MNYPPCVWYAFWAWSDWQLQPPENTLHPRWTAQQEIQTQVPLVSQSIPVTRKPSPLWGLGLPATSSGKNAKLHSNESYSNIDGESRVMCSRTTSLASKKNLDNTSRRNLWVEHGSSLSIWIVRQKLRFIFSIQDNHKKYVTMGWLSSLVARMLV